MNAKPSLHSTAVIPAQAGMTAEVSAKLVAFVFRQPLPHWCTL